MLLSLVIIYHHSKIMKKKVVSLIKCSTKCQTFFYHAYCRQTEKKKIIIIKIKLFTEHALVEQHQPKRNKIDLGAILGLSVKFTIFH